MQAGEVLDQVLEDYVEDLKTVREIARERKLDEQVVLRVVRLIERSEFKRQQAPPGFTRSSTKAFGCSPAVALSAFASSPVTATTGPSVSLSS